MKELIVEILKIVTPISVALIVCAQGLGTAPSQVGSCFKPIGLGLAIRAFLPAAADRIAPMLGKVGTIGLLVVVLFALVALYPALLNMDGWSYLVIVAVSAAALAIGHLSGPNDPGEKTSLAVECGVRHPALAINIAVANFGRTDALPVLVPCILTFIAVAMFYLIWRGRSR